MRDLYLLVATLGQQIDNQGKAIRALKVEVSRETRHQQENVQANAASIEQLGVDLARLRVDLEGVKAWQITHAFTCPYSGMPARMALRTQLQQLLYQMFNTDELEELGFSLGVQADDIKGETLGVKAQELVLYCERRGIVDKLLGRCRELRPGATWPLAYE
jgi:hypothetical protein